MFSSASSKVNEKLSDPLRAAFTGVSIPHPTLTKPGISLAGVGPELTSISRIATVVLSTTLREFDFIAR